jgi:hypothetical protein
MTRQDFIAAADLPLLEAAGLADFDALWRLRREPVEPPNTERGGWSSVCRLDLPGQGYFLKRQSNHLARSLAHPFGVPTLAREFRNIRRYAERQVPALRAAFFGTRKIANERRAILLTRALSGWRDLASWLTDWPQFSPEERAQLIDACGLLARRLHAARLTHGCFYPRHIFARSAEKGFETCLIDLEKTRSLHLRRERVRDMEQFLRYAPQLDESEINRLLARYLDAPMDAPIIGRWRQWLANRQARKTRTPSFVDVRHENGNAQHQRPGQIEPEQKNGQGR